MNISSNLKNKTIIGDCLDILSKIESNSIDLIIIDPPYKLEMPKTSGVDTILKKKGIKRVDEEWDKFTLEEYIDWSEKWIKESFRVVKDTGSVFIFGSYHNIGLINYILQKNKIMIINDIVWYKRNAVPHLACRRLTASVEHILWASNNKKYSFNYDDLKNGNFPNDKIKIPNKQMRNIWDIPTAGNENVGHPTQKPVEVYKRCIMAGINKNINSPIILDFFAGSGTCAQASIELGYDYILVEKEEKYLSAIEKRIKMGFDKKNISNNKIQDEETANKFFE
jgi:site-specific DNA-methyltransferase (adenine-specific)